MPHMDSIELTVKNYRSFSDSHSMQIIVEPGIASVIGPNNSGKSTILRFIYETRVLWQLFLGPYPNGHLVNLLGGYQFPFRFDGVHDQREVFHNRNDRPMVVQFAVRLTADNPHAEYITHGEFTIPRPTKSADQSHATLHARTNFRDELWKFPQITNQWPTQIQSIHFALTEHLFRLLADTFYIAAYRNAIN
jgi:hypothetical protein